MSKDKSFTIKIPKLAKRNSLVVSMNQQCKARTFHHKTEEKGGDINEQREFLDQAEEEKDSDEQDY